MSRERDNLDICAKAATDAGLSYGQYMAKLETKRNRKAAGIAPQVWMDNSRIPVIATCIETGESRYYPSLQETMKDGFLHGGVSEAVSGKRKSHHGWTFRRATQLEVDLYEGV